MSVVEPSFERSTFSKNRARLLEHTVAQQFFDAVVAQANGLGLLSDEHFTVDGTLIEAAASLKSLRPKDEPPSAEPPDDPGNPSVNFHGQRRSNATHQSTTDPEARFGQEGQRQRSPPGVHGSCADGESPRCRWPACRCAPSDCAP